MEEEAYEGNCEGRKGPAENEAPELIPDSGDAGPSSGGVPSGSNGRRGADRGPREDEGAAGNERP